jgi:hypothetical protein
MVVCLFGEFEDTDPLSWGAKLLCPLVDVSSSFSSFYPAWQTCQIWEAGCVACICNSLSSLLICEALKMHR